MKTIILVLFTILFSSNLFAEESIATNFEKVSREPAVSKTTDDDIITDITKVSRGPAIISSDSILLETEDCPSCNVNKDSLTGVGPAEDHHSTELTKKLDQIFTKID